MINISFIAGFIRWLFKGCKTNLSKECTNGTWLQDLLIALAFAFFMLGILNALFNHGIIG